MITTVVLFVLAIADSPVGVRLADMVKEKINSMELNSVVMYAAVGLFYTAFHSFLEEYYWRWFVYDLSKRFYSQWVSNVISSVGFAAHHVILLGFFFGWESPWTYVISEGIAVGGVVWAWMYQRDRTVMGSLGQSRNRGRRDFHFRIHYLTPALVGVTHPTSGRS